MVVDSDGSRPASDTGLTTGDRQARRISARTGRTSEMTTSEKVQPRLKLRYREEIRTPSQGSSTTTTSCRSRCGEGGREHGRRRRRPRLKLINGAISDLGLITGQKPEVRRARSRSRSSSCARACRSARVTLRGDYMWSSSTVWCRSPFRVSVTSAVFPTASSTAMATTPSGSTSSRCSTRSTSTRSTDRAVWTSPLSSATNDDEGRALLKGARLPVQNNNAKNDGRKSDGKKALVNKANKKPKFAVRGCTRVATSAVVRTRLTGVSSACAACACAKWRMPASCRACRSPAGELTVRPGPHTTIDDPAT